MKILYFVPGPLSTTALGAEELERRRQFLARRAFAGTEVAVREAAHGPKTIESCVEECLSLPAVMEAIPPLEKEGFDAAIIGCFDDPGLAGARELAQIPIIGPGLASCHWAAQLGDRFAIITVVEEVIPLLRRLMRVYGLEGLVTDILAVEVPVLELHGQREAVLENLADEGKAAVQRGADVLVLGCMTMGFLGIARDLQDRLQVPVVNPVLAGLKAAETAVAMSTTHSRRAYPTPRKGLPDTL
ncbi:aspartate/glutamate racemase family protein [Gemmatimonadota bacterium]